MTGQAPSLPSVERLFEEMPCGLLVTATDGLVLRANATFCGWVGLAAEELVGRRRLQELLTMGARIFHQTHWLPMLQMQGSISEIKLDVKVAGGATLPMLLNVVRRHGEGGSYDEIVAVIAEDRNRYERELLAARKRADGLAAVEQDRALFAEQMIGIVSHDLRSPLAVILLASKALTQDRKPLGAEQAARLLSNITRSAEKAQRLVEDLLDFTVARLGAGLAVTRVPVDLHLVVEHHLESLAIAFPGCRLVHHRTGDGLVEADEGRIAQLLGNLVGNALAYGDAEAAVTVTTGVAGDEARLAVHNHGAPILPATQATMFDPMVRGVSGDSAVRNVGLGLFIVKAIATAHGGQVGVSSTAADGTEFSLTFPRLAPGGAPQAG